MSHHIHNTEAIVVGSVAIGEADRIYWLLTAELGLLVARAQGVRKEKSKMRYGLQEFSTTNVSLIEGRAGWRLTGAVLNESLHVALKDTKALQAVAKIFDLVKRFVAHDESNTNLFEIVKNGLLDLTKEDVSVGDTEILLVARILQELGYLPDGEAIATRKKSKLLEDINEAIIHADL